MAKITNIFKTLRRNWKKSTFGGLLLGYGVYSTKRKYDINIFMKACCKEAEQYGNEVLPISSNPRTVTVILNPAANKKSAKDEYEKYCEPLLHMAGISVNLLLTNSVGHAKDIVATLPENEPIVVAGGDGALSEALTGILRLNEVNNKRKVGVLPLGRINDVGNRLFPLSDSLPKVKQLTSATMAVIKNNHELKDVMKIEVKSDDGDLYVKPIFALGAIEWGAYRDAHAKRDSYWVYGRLRDYLTYVFNGYKSSLNWDCQGTLKLTPPCEGCNYCQKLLQRDQRAFRLLDLIMPKTKENESKEKYLDVVNDQCDSVKEKQFKTANFNLSLVNRSSRDPAHLLLCLGKQNVGYFEFISDSWRRVNKNIIPSEENIKARTVEILPEKLSKEGAEIWFEIDNEEYDLKPIKVTILPKAINMFCLS